MATTMRDSSLPAGVGDYPTGEPFDEAIAAPGEPRELYADVIAALEGRDLVALARRAQAEAAAKGVTFGPGATVGVDPVPRLIGGSEWQRLEAGLLQRVRALNAFLLDAYDEQAICAEGRVPRHLLETSPGFEPRMRGILDPHLPPATVAGLDIVRDPAGDLRVLEDNLRMPSGSSYATALREVVMPLLEGAVEPRPLGPFAEALGGALGSEGVAIVSDGPQSGAWFEHQALSRALGVPIVVPEELETTGGRLYARSGRERRRIDVIYRRLDEERLSGPDGAPTALGELLLPALESGNLRCLNAFGTGVADDKLAHAYVEQMIDFYLGEEPLLASVPTIDLCEAAGRAEAEARLDELVIKPRDGFGGQGVTIVSAAGAGDRERLLETIRRRPESVVAQEEVALSTHPTICGGVLRPRRVDLRPFVVSGTEGPAAMPGGLTRFARGAGDAIVNSSRGGGCKDTWVVDR